MKISYKNIAIIGLAIVVFLLLWRGCVKEENLEEQLALNSAAQDTLRQFRDKDGKQVSEIALLTATSAKALANLQTSDSTIIHLKGVVKDYDGKLASATVAYTATTDRGSTVTTITGGDTVRTDSLIYIYPTYSTSWDERWSKGSIFAGMDSIYRDFKSINEYEFTQGWKRPKWFKAKQPVVTMRNLNPNTVTEELRSFTVTEKKGAYGLGVIGGVGVTTGLKVDAYVGIGFYVRLLEF